MDQYCVGDLKTPKFPFEINWPLAILQIEFLRIDHCEFEMQAVGNHYDGFIELEKIMTHTH